MTTPASPTPASPTPASPTSAPPEPQPTRSNLLSWTSLGGIVAVCALGATVWQAHISQDTEKRQLRAYVSPVIVSDHPDDIGRFNLKNFGQTPASQEIVTNEMQELTLPPNGEAELKKKADGLRVGARILSKTIFQGDSIQWEIGTDSDLQAIHVQWDKAPEKILVTVGRVSYNDVFNERHETSFCFFQKHNIPVALECPSGNDSN